MEKITLFTITLLVILLGACNKSLTTTSNPSLVGKWKLTETLADPGDGRSKWMPVADTNQSIVQFNPDNSIEGNLFKDFKRYKVINDFTIEFASSDNDIKNYRYVLYKSSLVMNPPCIEACGLRLIRINQ